MKKRIGIAAVLFLLLAASACTQTVDSARTVSSVPEVTEESGLPIMTEAPTEDTGSTTQEETAMRISVQSEQIEIIYELNDSQAAAELFAQLPITTEVEPFSNNEMTFYPEKLDISDAPLSDGQPGSLSYYEPWGDVVMFYAPCTPNNSLFELGKAVSGADQIENLSGTITVTAAE